MDISPLGPRLFISCGIKYINLTWLSTGLFQIFECICIYIYINIWIYMYVRTRSVREKIITLSNRGEICVSQWKDNRDSVYSFRVNPPPDLRFDPHMCTGVSVSISTSRETNIITWISITDCSCISWRIFTVGVCSSQMCQYLVTSVTVTVVVWGIWGWVPLVWLLVTITCITGGRGSRGRTWWQEETFRNFMITSWGTSYRGSLSTIPWNCFCYFSFFSRRSFFFERSGRKKSFTLPQIHFDVTRLRRTCDKR